MNLIQESAGVDGSGLAFLEACLIYLGGDKMGVLGFDPLQDGFFHDLGYMRAHHDGSDLIEATRTLGERFL